MYTSCYRKTRPLTRRDLAVSFKARSIQLLAYPIPTLICEIEAENIHTGAEDARVGYDDL